MQRRFLIMWNRDGLQYVADQVRISGEQVWARVSGVEPRWHPDVMYLRTLAQRQPHLHFEIWEFLADDGITEADIKSMFQNQTQKSADTIRSLGTCLYSDRPTTPAKIT